LTSYENLSLQYFPLGGCSYLFIMPIMRTNILDVTVCSSGDI